MVAGGWRTQGPLEKYFDTPIVSQKIWTTLLATFSLAFMLSPPLIPGLSSCLLFVFCLCGHQPSEKVWDGEGVIEELNKTMEQL